MYNRLIRNSLIRYAQQFNSDMIKIPKRDEIRLKMKIHPIHKNYHSSKILLQNSELTSDRLTPQENSQLNSEDAKLVELLKMEIEVLRLEGKEVPINVKQKHLEYLLNHCKSKSSKRQYLKYLWKSEIKGNNDKKRRAEAQIKRKEEWEEKDQHRIPGSLKYSLTENSMFLRFHEKRMNQLWNNKLIQAMQFESKIVFDCDYERYMRQREVTNAAKQVTMSFALNRQHEIPLDLYLCNAKKGSMLMDEMKRFIPTLYDDEFPMNVTESCYLDIFDKRDIVYLTPHCNNNLTRFDPDKIYIVGALVDKSTPTPLSMAKAKRQGVAMAKLPLDNYLKWGDGSGKNLTINQMMGILLDIRLNNDWSYAFRHVPSRKLTGAAEYRGMKRVARSLQDSGVQDFTIGNRRVNLNPITD